MCRSPTLSERTTPCRHTFAAVLGRNLLSPPVRAHPPCSRTLGSPARVQSPHQAWARGGDEVSAANDGGSEGSLELESMRMLGLFWWAARVGSMMAMVDANLM
jgi:hypothetical protein